MQISIINKSGLERTLRIDSEYYQPKYIAIEKIISKLSNVLPVTELCHVSDGNHMSIAEHFIEEDGIPYYRGQDIIDFFLENVNPVFIPNKIYNTPLMKRSHFKVGDVLLSIVGTIGNLSLVTENIKQATGSCKIAILRPQNIISEYLAIYLMSRYGNEQIKRNTRGAVQTGLILEDFSQIYVVTASEGFQKLIGDIVNKSLLHNIRAHGLYGQAEQILLSELDLVNWKPKHRPSFIKNFSDTQKADRIDAEYFQPMYEEVESILAKKHRVPLELLCSLINYGTVPTSPYCENGTPYIKGMNLINGFVGGEFDKIENINNLPRKFYVKENDIIISQMGTVGKAGIVTKNEEGYLFASFTIRIRLKDHKFIDPLVLTLYINAVAKDWYILRKIAQASVRQNTDLPTIKQLMVPEINNKVQQKIKQHLLDSYKSKQSSKHLLNIAKRGVEIAIEKSEKDAEKWIAEEMNKSDIKNNGEV